MYYVYEIVNLLGCVEWVGKTDNPKRRFRQHTCWLPSDKNRNGLFYNRQDVFMNIVKEFEDKKEALRFEFSLQEEWGFIPENLKTPRGIKHGRSKFTEDEIRKIRNLCSQGNSCSSVSKLFNTTRSTIGKIKNRQSWKHVE
jgi:hypothetical protein